MKFLKLPNIKKIFKFLIQKKILAILFIVGILIFLITPKNNDLEKIKYAKLERKDLKQTIQASGTLTGIESVNLKFNSPGKLAYKKIRLGDRVEKGAIVAGLDIQELNIDLQQAWNNYRAKQAAVEKVLDDVKGRSDSETFIDKDKRTTAEVARDNAFDSIKSAQRAFQDAVIYAPISGVVVSSDPLAGQFVGVTDIIAKIVDDSELIFETEIDESDLSKISLNQSVEVNLNSYPDQTFYGTVYEINPKTKTTTSGATVVNARVKLNTKAVRFVDGLNGQADLIIKESKNALSVPIETVIEETYIYVQDGKNYKKVKIEKGIETDSEVEVVSGLEDQNTIVTTPNLVKTQSGLNFFGGR